MIGNQGSPPSKKFFRRERPPLQIIGYRILFAVVLLLVVSAVFWVVEKDHIKDINTDGDFSYVDALYFTVVTVTTVGYGDIVPVTEGARMFDTLIITPVRILVWVLFIGTAYQFVILKYWEEYRMTHAFKKMQGHVIVAGYANTGTAAVRELIANGYGQHNLVVVDGDEQRIKEAADLGVNGLLGNPTQEENLLLAGVDRASVLIVATPQDDTNVLIALTARDLNPEVKIVSRVSQEENIKLLKRAGADVLISPSLTGGNLMAMAVSNANSVEMVSDLLTTTRGATLRQREIAPEEAGKAPKNLETMVVIGVVRDGRNVGPQALDGMVLEDGDEIVYLG